MPYAMKYTARRFFMQFIALIRIADGVVEDIADPLKASSVVNHQ